MFFWHSSNVSKDKLQDTVLGFAFLQDTTLVGWSTNVNSCKTQSNAGYACLNRIWQLGLNVISS